jgi:hypothetical protein
MIRGEHPRRSALVAAYAAEPGGGGDWDTAAARFSEIELPAGRAAYVAAVATAQGRMPPMPSLSAAACPPPDTGPDFASAIWRPSPNFDDRAADSTGVPHMVIIHTCESNYASCWSWLVNAVSQVSAHYVVNEDVARSPSSCSSATAPGTSRRCTTARSTAATSAG